MRPLPLPHHRTCGLPHPAVEPGGVVHRGMRTRPFPAFHSAPSAPSTAQRNPRTPQCHFASESTGVLLHHRPGRLPQLQRPSVSECFPFSSEGFGVACFVVLRPFAPRGFPRFFATMASADSSSTLIKEVSPGKAPRLSARIVRLYLVRLSVTLDFAFPSTLIARTRPHCLFVFLRSCL